MKKRALHILAVAALLIACAMPAPAVAKGWETVKQEKVTAPHVASDSELEIRAGGGIIYVSTTRKVDIKIFSILGSRIADDTLAPGSYQFVVPTHGVFIIKAGDITCKVAV